MVFKEMWAAPRQAACFGDEYTLDHSDADVFVTVGWKCTFWAYFGKIYLAIFEENYKSPNVLP